MNVLRKLLRDQRGASLIEYVLIAALISVVATAALTAMGVNLTTILGAVNTTLTGAGG